jgi:DNA polymerase III gamma/tau subunit
LEEIAIISAGGMRDALGMLDQLSSSNENITVEKVSSNFGSVSTKKLDEIIGCIETNDSEKLINILGNIQNSGTNYTVFIDKMILELRKNAIGLKTGKYKHRLFYEDIYNMIFDLNELLSNKNIGLNPYVLIEIVLLKYINKENNKLSTSNSSSNYFPGNNLNVFQEDKLDKSGNNIESKNEDNDDKKYFPGNNFDNVNGLKSDLGNNTEALGNNLDNQQSADKQEYSVSIDVNVRINNCFVDASKDEKKWFVDDKVNFLNYLLGKDRGLVSLLADINVLAASAKYVLIQSKNPDTNNLINQEVDKIESYYKKYSKKDVRFAAVNDDLWKKEVEKYRLNLKNKIKYNYIEEKILSSENISDNDESMDVDDIEKVASEIFDSFEIE